MAPSWMQELPPASRLHSDNGLDRNVLIWWLSRKGYGLKMPIEWFLPSFHLHVSALPFSVSLLPFFPVTTGACFPPFCFHPLLSLQIHGHGLTPRPIKHFGLAHGLVT